jgi:hypothetical protein
MTWQAIQYVTSGLTLAAFVAALLLAAFRARLNNTAKLILSSPEDKRAALVQSTLTFYHIPVETLTKEQRFKLALELITRSNTRYKWAVILIGFIALLLACIVAFTVLKTREDRAAAILREREDRAAINSEDAAL